GARARRAGSGQELEPGDPMSSQAPPERRSRRDIDGGQTTTAARSPSWTPSQTTARQPSRRAQRSVCSTRTSNAPSRRGTKCPCLQSTGTFAFVRGFMSSARAPRAWILYLGLSVLVLAAYAPALGGSFLWDDHTLILDSPLVRGRSSLGAFFDSAFWEVDASELRARGYYRPLTILSFAIDHALHGTNAAGFHLTNVMLHATNTVLLAVLLARAGMAPVKSALAALLWALVPRLTEAVAWISGRTDVLATTFVLAALVVALPKSSAPRRW